MKWGGVGGGEGVILGPDYTCRHCAYTGGGESGLITDSITRYCHQLGIKCLNSAKKLITCIFMYFYLDQHEKFTNKMLELCPKLNDLHIYVFLFGSTQKFTNNG